MSPELLNSKEKRIRRENMLRSQDIGYTNMTISPRNQHAEEWFRRPAYNFGRNKEEK